MKRFLSITCIFAITVIGAAAQGAAPSLKVSCNIDDAKIQIENITDGLEAVTAMPGRPIELEEGIEYVLSVTKGGYEPYRKLFKAEWSGPRETQIKLILGIGPVEGEEWSADLEDGVTIEFVPIPAGQFMMGSYVGDRNERPLHRVEIKRPFWMAETEVTNQQFEQYQQHLDLYKSAAVKQQGIEQRKKLEKNEVPMPQGATYPQAYVTWNEAVGFCKWLTKKEQRRGRLPEGYEYAVPTEAEWEYACRAGTTTEYAGRPEMMAWFSKNSSLKTNPVGQKKPNAWGLYDMHGIVWEWCVDIWYSNYFNAPEDGSQRGDRVGEYYVDKTFIEDPDNIHRLNNNQYRVVRGGAWSTPLSACRSANRFYKPLKDFDNTNYSINCVGFRPVLVWMEPEKKLKSTNQLNEPVE